jgi:hypothetical protein
LELSKQGVATQVLTYINESNALAKQNAIADEMNKRAKERVEAEKMLRRERDMANQYFYDPFWGPISPAYRFYRGSRFGWGMRYGYPFGW